MNSRERKNTPVEDLLSSFPAPPAPEDLARKIQAEIPEELPVALPFPKLRRPPRLASWARIAAVIALAAAGYVGYRVSRPRPSAPEPVAVVPQPSADVAPPQSVAPVETPVAVAAHPPRKNRPADVKSSAPAVLEGKFTDTQGATLPGVVVTVHGAGGTKTAVADAAGRITLPLAAGVYDVEATIPGFDKQKQRIEIASGETKRFEKSLPLSAVAESVTVTASSPLIDTSATTVGSNNMVLVDGVNTSAPRAQVKVPGKAAPAAPNGFVTIAPPAAPPSTGGAREPNDQPYGDVFFRTYGVNPFIDTEDDHLSTFGLDVDTGSYSITRRYLADGNLPPVEAIRVEEFVNAFSYGDRPPSRGDFAISAEAAPTPFARGDRYRIVRFHLRARDVDPRDRKPAVLTFVVDVSGSMQQENRLELVKKALNLLLSQLRPSDRVGLVVFGTNARALLEPTSDLEAIGRAIDRLVPEGSTNTEEGLRVGYDMAVRHRRADGINRVILCSDGVANVGATGPDSILSVIEREVKQGIELTTVGFGMGNYNDILMEQLANKGNGRYAYVDTLAEARRIFVENLTGTLQTIAADAKVQVDFDPGVVARYRLLGYENRDIADEKFRDDKVDAGEIGAGHEVTALYEIKLAEGASSGTAATIHLRYRSADTKKIVEVEQAFRVSQFAASWSVAPRGLRLAALVAEFAEVLKHSYWAKGTDLADLAGRARRMERDFPGDARVAEFAGLVEKASALWSKSAAPPSDDQE